MKPTVLVVDDEPSILDVVARMLCRHFNVVTAARARDALQLVGTGIDAVLLDIMMPDMGGGEFLRELERRNLRVPVLLHSGVRECMDIVSPLIVDRIAKPVLPAVLRGAIHAALRPPT